MSKQRNINWFYNSLKQIYAQYQIIIPIFLVVLIIGSFGFNVLASNYDPPQKTISTDTGYDFSQYFKTENWIIATGKTGFEIWNINTSSLILRYQNPNSYTRNYRGVILPSNNLIAFIAETGSGFFNQLVFFNISSKKIQQIENFTVDYYAFAFSSAGTYYTYFNTTGNKTEIFYSANQTLAMDFTRNQYLNFSPDDSYVAQTINHTIINIYSTKNWKVIKELNLSSNTNASGILWSPTSNFAIIEQRYDYYNNALIYTKMNWSVYSLPNFTLLKQDRNITSGDLIISPNGQYVVFSTDHGFEIFNASDWKGLYQNNDSVFWSQIATNRAIGSLTFSNTGNYALFNTHDYNLPSNYDNVLYLYNSLTNTMTKLSFFDDIYQKYDGINSMVGTTAQLSPSGRYLFLDTNIAQTGAIIGINQNSGYSTSSPTEKVLLYDLATNKTIYQKTWVNQFQQGRTVQFSKDGNIASIRNFMGDSVRILDLKTGKTLLSSNIPENYLFVYSRSILIFNGNSAYIWTNVFQKNLIASIASFFNIYFELILSVILLISIILFKKTGKYAT